MLAKAEGHPSFGVQPTPETPAIVSKNRCIGLEAATSAYAGRDGTNEFDAVQALSNGGERTKVALQVVTGVIPGNPVSAITVAIMPACAEAAAISGRYRIRMAYYVGSAGADRC